MDNSVPAQYSLLSSVARRISIVSCIIITLVGVGFLAADLYALNRGFSFGDESYYALSYKMAAQGFYAHFTNTPFLIAPLVEWLHPNLIVYRSFHLVLALTTAILLVAAISLYIGRNNLAKKVMFCLTPFAICYAPYSYYLSAPGLSYNHINEALVLLSEACLLFAARTRHAIWLCFLAGILTALDVYVKPPTFLQLGLVNLILIWLMFGKGREKKRNVLLYFSGGIAALAFITTFVMTPSDWQQYLSLMQSHQTHPPLEVLMSFFTTAWKLTAQNKWFLAAALLGLGFLRRFSQAGLVSLMVFAWLLIEILRIAYQSLKFSDNHILGNCWEAWSYTSSIFVAITLICFASVLLNLRYGGEARQRQFLLVTCLLAVNPIVISLGTINGFGQVQLFGLSWFLIGGVAVFLAFQSKAAYGQLYLSMMLTVTACIFVTYYARQWMPLNPLGEGALLDQVYSVPNVPALRNMLVDEETRDVLVQVSTILKDHPDSSVIAFFDIPGLQYASDRSWVIRDPWLSDADVPKTRDDIYNCNLFTSYHVALHNSVFIVAHDNEISPDLHACLAKVGFPSELSTLGQVTMPSFLGGYLISLYFYP